MNITFITGNPGKAAELSNKLNVSIDHKKIDLPEIQTLDLKEISTFKAREAYKIVNSPVLVEDVGLVFHALNKLPGPFIKWFLTELKNEGLCKLLSSYQNKHATAEIVYTLFDGKELIYFEAALEGTIVDTPRGENGFGWDQIFMPDGQNKTYAEMTIEEKNKISHRAIALQKLQQYLNNSTT